jgi:hypothetical protein
MKTLASQPGSPHSQTNSRTTASALPFATADRRSRGPGRRSPRWPHAAAHDVRQAWQRMGPRPALPRTAPGPGRPSGRCCGIHRRSRSERRAPWPPARSSRRAAGGAPSGRAPRLGRSGWFAGTRGSAATTRPGIAPRFPTTARGPGAWIPPRPPGASGAGPAGRRSPWAHVQRAATSQASGVAWIPPSAVGGSSPPSDTLRRSRRGAHGRSVARSWCRRCTSVARSGGRFVWQRLTCPRPVTHPSTGRA